MKYQPTIVAAFFQSRGLPAPVFEHAFHPVRKWRMDVAWPASKVAIECDGGIWITGGHCRGAQIKKDWSKRNTATSMGWKVFYCEPRDLCTMELADFIKKALDKPSLLG